jgi:HK97 family phage portal protein
LLAESLASLPIKIYIKNPSGGPSVRYEGPSIFDRPSINGTLYDWLFTMMTSLLLQGNAWGFITGRDGYGYPTGIEWIPPEDVLCVDDEEQPWNPLLTRIYVYGRLVDKSELFHIKAFSIAGRTEGISPLRAFALTVLSGQEAQKYGTGWYQSGGFPPGVFENTEVEIDADQAEQIRAQLVDVIRRRQPLVTGRDWTYKPITVPPSEAQFLDAIQANATQVAAIFGLPPDRVGGKRGDSLTYNTVEQSTLQVIEALRPWLVRIETALFDIIPNNRYVRFNPDALLKTDLKTRTDIYESWRDMGLRTLDEIRDLEDMPPLPHGAGTEVIPADVMVAMARSIRAIPNSMLPEVTLETDLIQNALEKLQEEGLTAPDTGPVTPSPAKYLGSMAAGVRSMGDLDPEDMADREFVQEFLAARRRSRIRRNGQGPEFVGPWIPSEHERGGIPGSEDNPGSAAMDTNVTHQPAIFTAHRIDETLGHLSHTVERLQAARAARDEDTRAYETDRVATDMGSAQLATQRLVRNVQQNYPREAAELDRITKLATPVAARAVSLSPAHKTATFAHLLATILYNEAHAYRHAQVMTGETGDKVMWNFDADHCASHATQALEHAHKLADHICANYPSEAQLLARLRELEKPPAGKSAAAAHNGNGRAY